MKKEDKNAIIVELQETLGQYSHFYLTSIEGLNAEKTSQLRRQCFKNDIKLIMPDVPREEGSPSRISGKGNGIVPETIVAATNSPALSIATNSPALPIATNSPALSITTNSIPRDTETNGKPKER